MKTHFKDFLPKWFSNALIPLEIVGPKTGIIFTKPFIGLETKSQTFPNPCLNLDQPLTFLFEFIVPVGDTLRRSLAIRYSLKYFAAFIVPYLKSCKGYCIFSGVYYINLLAN